MPTISTIVMLSSKKLNILTNFSLKEFLLLSPLVVLGLIIRLIPVLKDNIFFGFDQGLDIILVRDLIIAHHLTLVSRYSGLQGVLMGPLWTWLMAIPFTLSGGDPKANVIFLAVLSVCSSILTYCLVKKILGRVAAIITFLFSLFSPFFVSNSQIVLSPHPLTYIFILYIWLIYEIFYLQKKVFFPLLCFLTGVFFQFEIAFALFAVPPVVLFAVKDLLQKRGLKVSHLFLGLALFFITFLPQFLFEIKHQFIMTNNLLGFFQGVNTSLYKTSIPFFERIPQRLSTFQDDFLQMTLSSHSAFIILPTVILAVFGWTLVIRKKLKVERQMFFILLLILLSYLIGFTLYPGAIWGWYRQGLPIVYVLLTTIPISVVWNQIKLAQIPLLVFGIFLLILTLKPMDIVKDLKSKSFADAATVQGQMQVLDYIYNDSQGKSFSYYAYTPPVYDYIWQYDFWWYGKKKYGYLPKNWQIGVPLLGIGTQSPPPTISQGLFYLIIEPNSQMPWAPNGWKESFIKVGKTVQRIKINNIEIEKRVTTE